MRDTKAYRAISIIALVFGIVGVILDYADTLIIGVKDGTVTEIEDNSIIIETMEDTYNVKYLNIN